MKKHLLLPTLLLLYHALGAQTQIAVQSGSTARFYTTLSMAIDSAPAGATITLPGGLFDIDNRLVTKPLRLVGIGHKASANPQGMYTQISGTLRIGAGANNSRIEGIYFAQAVHIGLASDDTTVQQITLSRCHFTDKLLLSDSPWPSQQLMVHECVLSDVDGGQTAGVLMLKNIVKGQVASFGSQTTFRNNLFLSTSAVPGFDRVAGSTFENNLFLRGFDNIRQCTLTNNLFVQGYSYDFGAADNIPSGNLIDVPYANLFINAPQPVFDYSYNYHAASTSPGAAAGTDGKEIGIYGTALPFKDNCTPDIPHIDAVSIGSATDNQGRLSISIKVSAQGN